MGDLLSRYRDIELAGRTLDEVQVEVQRALGEGCHLADLRCLAGTMREPVPVDVEIAGEWHRVDVDRFGPGDRMLGILVV